MNKAFSLLEVLVVMAIIALVAAIAFPVFAQAKRAARTTSCISNLHQAGAAIQMYQADSDGFLPCGEVLYWTNTVPGGRTESGSTRDMIRPLLKYAGGEGALRCGENNRLFLPRWVVRFNPALDESRLMIPSADTVLICCIHHLAKGYRYGTNFEMLTWPREGIQLLLRADGSVSRSQAQADVAYRFASSGGHDRWTLTDMAQYSSSGNDYLVHPNETWPPAWLKLPENPSINWGRGNDG